MSAHAPSDRSAPRGVESTYVPSFVNECVTTFRMGALGRELSLATYFDNGFPEVARLDQARTRALMTNLLSAAARLCPGRELQLRISGSLVPNDPRLNLEIRDSALSERELARVPKSSASAHHQLPLDPVGIADLAMARMLASLLGGTLTMTSVTGVGSALAVSIAAPAAVLAELEDETPARAPLQATDNETILSGLHVLAVIRDDSSRRTVQATLLRSGASLTSATSGTEALALFNRTPLDAILIDMEMTDMDGRETTRALLARGCRIPIVAISTHMDPVEREVCLNLGCAAVMFKPIEPATLTRTLAQLTADHCAAGNAKRRAA